mmetsp:Transcript_31044/g.46078  ORF Transcript_31044/g.46078 Transcript_31044/m.46078 type:complete len:84 (+) Transcript_31044:274-525(+)
MIEKLLTTTDGSRFEVTVVVYASSNWTLTGSVDATEVVGFLGAATGPGAAGADADDESPPLMVPCATATVAFLACPAVALLVS